MNIELSGIWTLALAPFGNVSVVMMARAAISQPSGRALATRSATTGSNRSAGSGSPSE